MKKLLLMAGMVLLIQIQDTQAQSTSRAANSGRSQFTSLGPVAGVGMSWVGNMGGNMMMLPAYNVGIGLVYARNEHWGWGGQLTLAQEGYYMDYGTYRMAATPLYLRMPLRAYYFFGDYRNTVRPKVYLGPSFAAKLSEKDKTYNDNEAIAINRSVSTFRNFDAGLNVGAGINILVARSTWLNMDLGYYQGFTDALKDPEDQYNTNQNLGFNIGLLFGIK
jgi:hypothetical protein